MIKILYRMANLKKLIIKFYFYIFIFSYLFYIIRLILEEYTNIFIDHNFVNLFFIPFQIFHFISIILDLLPIY